MAHLPHKWEEVRSAPVKLPLPLAAGEGGGEGRRPRQNLTCKPANTLRPGSGVSSRMVCTLLAL